MNGNTCKHIFILLKELNLPHNHPLVIDRMVCRKRLIDLFRNCLPLKTRSLRPNTNTMQFDDRSATSRPNLSNTSTTDYVHDFPIHHAHNTKPKSSNPQRSTTARSITQIEAVAGDLSLFQFKDQSVDRLALSHVLFCILLQLVPSQISYKSWNSNGRQNKRSATEICIYHSRHPTGCQHCDDSKSHAACAFWRM